MYIKRKSLAKIHYERQPIMCIYSTERNLLT